MKGTNNMKFYVGSKQTGAYFKNEIREKFDKNGGFVSLAEVRDLFRETPNEDDTKYGWDSESDLVKKMRVRECKDGWYLYLPDLNAKICFDKKKEDEVEKGKSKVIANIEPNIDVCVFETEIFEQLIKVIEEGFELLKRTEIHIATQNEEFLYNQLIPSFFFYTRPCVVKAKKSGRKEERQDRNAKFHRWADLSKGVRQVVAIVEFEDGHIEQVQPDRVVFKGGSEDE